MGFRARPQVDESRKVGEEAPPGRDPFWRRAGRLARLLAFLALAAALAVGVKAVQNRRDVALLEPIAEYIATRSLGASTGYRILDPYAVEGEWFKVQLHTHTAHSLDSGRPVEEALQAYADAGYDFVAITDHDFITRPDSVPGDLLVVPAEENTVTFPFWPLGQHAVFFFIEEQVSRGSAGERFEAARTQGGLVAIAHPNWVGNLGLGRWEMRHLMAVPQFTLMEVYNSHSNSRLDTGTWHEAMVRRGPGDPVWAVAVDDAHDLRLFDAGWTMVKAAEHSLPALKEALERGSLYATTGPLVRFGLADGAIVVDGDDESSYEVKYISLSGEAVETRTGSLPARYRPYGTEGFVRVEVHSVDSNRKAWSQPFWLVSAAVEAGL